MEYVIDAVLAVLLGAVMVTAYTLNRRIRDFKAGQADLGQLIKDLSAASETAERSVARLREAAETSEKSLRTESARARALADELTLIVEAGDSLADRLAENAVRARRDSEDNAMVEQILYDADDGVLDALQTAR